MAKQPNFYETVEECRLRLRHTIVLYDGQPYFVLEVSNHKQDGRFRIYLDPIARKKSARNTFIDFPDIGNMHFSNIGPSLDTWIDNNPNQGVVRKFMNAAGFDKYRPFPLGNMHREGNVIYVERTPTRQTFQGLRSEALICMPVSPVPDRETLGKKKTYYSAYTEGKEVGVEIYGDQGFYDMITNNYPTAQEVVDNLKDPTVINAGVAFHREFSIFRGPLGMLILCYQHQGIGILSNKNLTELKISKDYDYLIEQIQDLNVFGKVTVEQE